MKKFLFLILFLPLIPACVSTMVFLTGATMGGMIIYDKRSMKTMLKDHNIAYKAQEFIKASHDLRKTTHITVTVFNRVVLLVGQAPTPRLRARAVALVRSVPRVKKIYNQITIGAPSSMLTRMSDSTTTAKVKAALLSNEGFKSTQMKVITENGVVYLMGLVPSDKGKEAAEVVRKVSGVQQVVKVFENPR